MSRPNSVGVYCGYAAALVVFCAPIAWMVIASFHKSIDISSVRVGIAGEWTTKNYAKLFSDSDILRYILNSIIVAGGSTALALLIGAPASFAFVERGMHRTAFAMLIARMAPGILFVIPFFIVGNTLGLLSSTPLNYIYLIVTHLVITLPTVVWLLIPFFESIPAAINEAARLDGASTLVRFAYVNLPLVRSGLGVSIVLSFVFAWNFFLFVLILARPETITLPILSFGFIGQGSANWGGLMAAAVLIATPAVILTIAASKLISTGVVSGAVKA